MAARVADITAARKKGHDNLIPFQHPVTDEERAQICAAVAAGESQHSVAKKFKRSKGTINRIVHEASIARSPRSAKTEAATQARKDFTAENRREVLNAAFAKAEELLPLVDRPTDLAQVAQALERLISVARLEEGEATSRTESSSTEPKTKAMARLDELAQRRKA